MDESGMGARLWYATLPHLHCVRFFWGCQALTLFKQIYYTRKSLGWIWGIQSGDETSL
jgi:hypothetical protein